MENLLKNASKLGNKQLETINSLLLGLEDLQPLPQPVLYDFVPAALIATAAGVALVYAANRTHNMYSYTLPKANKTHSMYSYRWWKT